MNSLTDNLFARIYRKYNSLDRRAVSIAVIIIYCLILIAGFIFHEQTPDEAKAWIIGRDASIRDIIFYIPRYEGHPPFWHLLLAIPAKLGMDYELSLCIIQFIGAGLLVTAFEFLTPFNNLARTFIPFTYYFMFRWGIYQRPYVLLALGLILAAYAYGKRKTKPLLFIGALAFICIWSMYGVAMAGGITIAWIIEIIADSIKEKQNPLSAIFKDIPRLIGFVVLLLFALAIIRLVLPAADNYTYTAVKSREVLSYLGHVLKVILFVPAESFVTAFKDGPILYFDYSPLELVICIFCTFVFYFMVFLLAPKKITTLYFVVPFLCLVGVSADYFYQHHFGTVVFLAIFYFAVCMREKEGVGLKGQNKIIYKLLPAVAVGAFCVMGIYWSFMSLLGDALYDSSCGKKLSSWIKENGLEELTMDCAWYTDIDKNGKLVVTYPEIGIYSFVIEAPYFEKNQVRNAIDGTTYNLTMTYSDEKINALLDEIRKEGSPDLIYAFNDQVEQGYLKNVGIEDEYVPVYSSIEVTLFKDKQSFFLGGIMYARSDIAEKYGLETIAIP
ncbi:MAG: hypothetical protein J5715_10155 [Clostridiales bacterium]|nr:hypothetical protein [Clostridiales bacterium]